MRRPKNQHVHYRYRSVVEHRLSVIISVKLSLTCRKSSLCDDIRQAKSPLSLLGLIMQKNTHLKTTRKQWRFEKMLRKRFLVVNFEHVIISRITETNHVFTLVLLWCFSKLDRLCATQLICSLDDDSWWWQTWLVSVILFFPIPHNALCLSPKFCVNYCCEILLGICRPPKSLSQQ